MRRCLFCQSLGPYSTIEHIIPESLGNDDLILTEEVCDSCQAYFGKEVEQFALGKTPIAFWRTFLGIKTKKGKEPSVDLSQPKSQTGILPAIHPKHDNIGFTHHEDGAVSVEIDDPNVARNILDGSQSQFTFIMTPKVLHMLGRFLCKVGLELLCLADPDQARAQTLSSARRYARHGDFDGLWPIFHFSRGTLSHFKRLTADAEGLLEQADCFSYSVIDFQSRYLLLRFSMGTDNWLISLNDPYPDPAISNAFPEDRLNLIWYSAGEWKTAL